MFNRVLKVAIRVLSSAFGPILGISFLVLYVEHFSLSEWQALLHHWSALRDVVRLGAIMVSLLDTGRIPHELGRVIQLALHVLGALLVVLD